APDRAAASVGAGARPALVSIVGGWRIFSSQLGLRDDASAGLRLGLGVAPRVVLMTDFTVSGANRSVGTGTATVHALRMLARSDRRFATAFTLLLLASASLSCSDIALKPKVPVRVSGMIADRDGAPMAGAWIAFDNADPTYPYDPSTHAQVQTDAAGAYAVTLVAGRYDVSAQPPFSSGYATARVRGVELRTAPATFSYRFSGLKVTGVVTVPGGAPLASGAAS